MTKLPDSLDARALRQHRAARALWRRRSGVTLVLAVALASPAFAVPAASAAGTCTDPGRGADYGGGTGEAADPYRIETVAHLSALRDRFNAGAGNQAGCHFLQTADLDLGSVASWVAIGDGSSSARRFHGVYDGGLRAIRNLTITTVDPAVSHYGLFGSIRDGAIRDLRLVGVDIDLTFAARTDSVYVGALVAEAESSSGPPPGTTTIASSLVEGTIDVTYVGEGNLYVGGIVGRSRRGTLVDDRLAFRGTIRGDVTTTDSDESDWFNFGGLVGRTSSDSRLSLGYAAAEIAVTVRPKETGSAETPVYVGILTGSSSSGASELSELYAAGSITTTNLGEATVFVGPIGLIENEADTFTDIFFLDTILAGTYAWDAVAEASVFSPNTGPGAGLAGGAVNGYLDDPDVGGLFNVLARSDAQMRQGSPATTMLTATPGSGRWVYNNAPGAAQPTGKWYLVLEPAPGEYAYPVFYWEILAATGGSPGSGTRVPAGPSLNCSPAYPAAGAGVTCVVTGGDPDLEILWRASSAGGVFASAGVLLGPDGTGTFAFTAPTSGAIDVELVEWGAITTLRDSSMTPAPTRVAAGEGTSSVPVAPGALWWLLAIPAGSAYLLHRQRVVARRA